MILFSLILINLLFSIENILAIIMLSEFVSERKMQLLSLGIGLLGGAVSRIVIIYGLTFLMRIGILFYVLAGGLMLIIGILGFLKEDQARTVSIKHQHVGRIILAMVGIDVALSVDNIAGVLSLSSNIVLIIAATLISIGILFVLGAMAHAIFERIHHLKEIGYAVMLFLACKFLFLAFGIYLDDMSTFICLLVVSVLSLSFVLLEPRISPQMPN